MNSLRLKNRFFAIGDALICIIAYFLIFLLLYNKHDTFNNFFQSGSEVIISAFVYCLLMICFGVYRTDWVYAGTTEYIKLISGCLIAGTTNVMLSVILPKTAIFLKFSIVANITAILGICICRFLIRLLYDFVHDAGNTGTKRILIIGAGNLAISFLRDIAHNGKMDYKAVGLVDDDERKQGVRYYGAKVLGTRNDIERICSENNIDEIVFAIYSIDPGQKVKLLDICSRTGKKVKILQSFAERISDIDASKREFRDIAIEDLLERDSVSLDNELIVEKIKGKVVLVTGAGGSIGSELCRQIVKFEPARLVILDIYENTTYDLQNELQEEYPYLDLVTLIASVRDKNRLESIFDEYRPSIVFHAAAHKHVPLMEDSPCEAIKNNVLGTYNTAMCAKSFNVGTFVLISTDKAVNPTNVMGASKRMCEMIIQTLQKYSETKFVAVRFGNVLGSNGSVIPRFKKQIEKGGPVTVTHPEITRFFMTIPEAAQLVLQAASYARGGEIFVLDMGQPVKIYDLARKMISLSGYKPDEDIKIEFTGLRPGEKLYEELLMNEEGLEQTAHKKIFVGKPCDMPIEELEDKISRLKASVDCDSDTVKRVVAEVVPTYCIYVSK